MTDTYGVWAYNDDPEWLLRNCGIADMVLTSGMDLYAACFLRDRLVRLMSGSVFEIRTALGQVVTTETTRNPGSHALEYRVTAISAGPAPIRRIGDTHKARRPLGKRGQ